METPEEIARRIAAGHAFSVHVVEKREFEDEEYGQPLPVHTREDLAAHIVAVLESKETLCCSTHSTLHTTVQADIFYHPATNTFVIVPANPSHEPTTYRPNEGFAHFHMKVAVSMESEKLDRIPIHNSIYELRPELAAAKEAQRIKEADGKLRVAIEQRFANEKEQMQQRHRRELQHSSERERDQKRHATELIALERKNEEDFQRYRREREAALALREHQEKKERERQQGRQIDGPILGGRAR